MIHQFQIARGDRKVFGTFVDRGAVPTPGPDGEYLAYTTVFRIAELEITSTVDKRIIDALPAAARVQMRQQQDDHMLREQGFDPETVVEID